MLGDAPMLVSASFEIADPPILGRFSIDCPKTKLSHLRHLTIKFRCHEQGSGEIGINEFFEALILPALEELHLETSDLSYDDELHLTRMKWNNTCLIRFLRTVPTLKHLHLQVCTTDIDSFRNLFYMLQYIPESTDNVLPNLRKIEVHEVPMLDWESGDDDDLLMRCFESRWWPEGSSPHKQEGLSRLTDVAVRWTDEEPIAGDIGAQRSNCAERLRAGGMKLIYPSLIS